jgi:hypothetical protein
MYPTQKKIEYLDKLESIGIKYFYFPKYDLTGKKKNSLNFFPEKMIKKYSITFRECHFF